MILYFDNLITNEPLYKGIYAGLDRVRDSCEIYKMPDKMKISMYTLASYAVIDWSEVIVKYQLDNESMRSEFESFVRNIFPKAHIIYGRSDNQKKFQETIKLINSFDDNWIFYAGNNDHPYLAPNNDILYACMKKAEEYQKEHKYVAVVYSHFTESLCMSRNGNLVHDISTPDIRVLEEDENCIVSQFPKGYFNSIQIVNKELMNHWFFSMDFGDAKIRRAEDAGNFIKKVDNQIVIIPKKELCAHFDGYGHTKKFGYHLSSEITPPLFIPPGFFEDNIKIAYGFENYKNGRVNINPTKQKFSFDDQKNGTDLMISLDYIPLFWKNRIKKIEVNPNADKERLEEAAEKRRLFLQDPFPKRGFFYKNYCKYRYRMLRKLGNLDFIPDSISIKIKQSNNFGELFKAIIPRSLFNNN